MPKNKSAKQSLRSKDLNTTMEELLAALVSKNLNLISGQEVTGKVISLDKREIILDLGVKSEGVILSRDIPQNILAAAKIGDIIKAYVERPENENGQVLLTYERQTKQTREKPSLRWNKFIQAKNQTLELKAAVVEINRGGLILEVDGVRGFLPGSQIGVNFIKQVIPDMDLIGKELIVSVIEIDERSNRLIFSQKRKPDSAKEIDKFKPGEKKKIKITANLAFAAFAQVDDSFGIIFPQEISWQKVEDPATVLKVGEEVEANILSVDNDLGRLTLSIRQAQKDPFTDNSKNYQIDETVSATVAAITQIGVIFNLADGLEGFMPSSKLTGVNYEVGQKVNVRVDSIDSQRRKINLSPFLTTTKGLIYK